MKLGELEFKPEDCGEYTHYGFEHTERVLCITLEEANRLLAERLEKMKRVVQINGSSPWFEENRLPAFEGKVTSEGRIVCIEEVSRG